MYSIVISSEFIRKLAHETHLAAGAASSDSACSPGPRSRSRPAGSRAPFVLELLRGLGAGAALRILGAH